MYTSYYDGVFTCLRHSSLFSNPLDELGKFYCIKGSQSGAKRGGKKGTNPRAPKSPNNVTSTFFNTVNLLPKDLRFEHGDPGGHVTPVRLLSQY